MDGDSSAKFIGSLTKFLQSLCNGYVDFQKGVELVGHIYLSIDTGEKVDYILHERVSKNDENSVTFVSNSFHAQPQETDSSPGNKGLSSKSGDGRSKDLSGGDDDDDDIMIIDQSKDVPGSTNSGTTLSRRPRPTPRSPRSFHRNQGSSNPVSSPPRNRQHLGGPSATVTSQENINMGDVKLEQISTDELLSLASQVGDGSSHSQTINTTSPRGGPGRIGQTSSLAESAGQPVWIKQEVPDNTHGGPDTGWSHGRDGHSDSSNSGSNLYPVMMHQNPAFTSSPVFPDFSSSHQHGHAQSLSATSGGAHPFINPMPGTSQGMSGIHPAVGRRAGLAYTAGRCWMSDGRLYRENLKRHNPERYIHFKNRQREACRRYREKRRLLKSTRDMALLQQPPPSSPSLQPPPPSSPSQSGD